MEDTRRRNDASMARKRANAKAINPAAAGSGIADVPLSPSSTGAMDSLLEKLRAAAPQARDQRDRRRRARLKDRHQVRVASGQTIRDLGDLTKATDGDDPDLENDNLKPTRSNATAEDGGDRMEPISEGEDIADRAASMLQGLRGDDGDAANSARPSSRDGGSLRVRRRRENADDERRNRRRRRMKEGSSEVGNDEKRADEEDAETLNSLGASEGPSKSSNAIPEEIEDEADEGEDTIMPDDGSADRAAQSPERLPKTVISPPSPEPRSSINRDGAL